MSFFAKKEETKDPKIRSDDNNHLGTNPMMNSTKSPSNSNNNRWRLRDPANDLLLNKSQSRSHQQQLSTTRDFVSAHFDIDSTLARLRCQNKEAVIRTAFQIAATMLLLKNPTAKEPPPNQRSVKFHDIVSSRNNPLLHDIHQIDALKWDALESSRQHKKSSHASGRKGSTTLVTKNVVAGNQPTLEHPKQHLKTKDAAVIKSSAGAAVRSSITDVAAPPSKSSIDAVVWSEDKGPKFTRNTPASSAAALDARVTKSRAIINTAAKIAFQALLPPIAATKNSSEATDIYPTQSNVNAQAEKVPSSSSSPTVAMEDVVLEAQALGQRIEAVAVNSARRLDIRYQHRKQLMKENAAASLNCFQVRNPFVSWSDDDEDDMTITPTSEASMNVVTDNEASSDDDTRAWQENCLPRFLSILHTGVGHAVYHDVQWATRHMRMARLLQAMADADGSFGSHLIVTVEPDVQRFAKRFRAVNSHVNLLQHVNDDQLRALVYDGSARERLEKRRRWFQGNRKWGLKAAPFHVIVTSYAHFLQDYAHFCQIPFEVTIMDQGISWMAAAQMDANSQLSTIWNNAIFSKNDHHIGLAGGMNSRTWDFTSDQIQDETMQQALIGLSTRHRIVTAQYAAISNQRSTSRDTLPVFGLMKVVAPHFMDAVEEEWDRSRLSTDQPSIAHFRKLLARSVVVHDTATTKHDMYQQALDFLEGNIEAMEQNTPDPPKVPVLVSDDQFVSDGKVSSSRCSALRWFGPLEKSWLRYELGSSSFSDIVTMLKNSSHSGYVCEEPITASCTTASGANGQVTGSLAYRLAVRCGRRFNSEQGLRQHFAAVHAPPATWLCRTCRKDCVTSQARTHHERSCGQVLTGSDSLTNDNNPPMGANMPGTTGPNGAANKSKKVVGQASHEDKKMDADGLLCVSGYRGVWIDENGKHLAKTNGACLQGEDGRPLSFDTADEAAKKYDCALKKANLPDTEYNFTGNGNRIVYNDRSSSEKGLGGGAASVVPALAVINIKDLPPDVKPLLRDPRQTSRTGGNSKRHVYAYRGVCRQARKGHDRWQSQISFMGVNHYLGTFDSEWDAAAIYSWAHLILYGEEATQQAQKEGEEAAAAYEKEKRDIAAGILPPTPPKPEKKKPQKKVKKTTTIGGPEAGDLKTTRKRGNGDDNGTEKKRAKVRDKDNTAVSLAQTAGRALVLARRDTFLDKTDSQLNEVAARRLEKAQTTAGICYRSLESSHPGANQGIGPLLLGISATSFGLDVGSLVSEAHMKAHGEDAGKLLLQANYGEGGSNESFYSVLSESSNLLRVSSSHTREMIKLIGLGNVILDTGIPVASCSAGGVDWQSSEPAVAIHLNTTSTGTIHLAVLSDEAIVTWNGMRVTPEAGSVRIQNEDICTVGSLVFVVILKR